LKTPSTIENLWEAFQLGVLQTALGTLSILDQVMAKTLKRSIC